MILPDVNVLIYAFRQDVPHHALCHSWLAGVANGDTRFGLSPLALSALVRVTTNPRSYHAPSTLEESVVNRPGTFTSRPAQSKGSVNESGSSL